MMGIDNVFSTEPASLTSVDDVVIFIRKIGFVMQLAANELEADGLFTNIDWNKSNECMQSI